MIGENGHATIITSVKLTVVGFAKVMIVMSWEGWVRTMAGAWNQPEELEGPDPFPSSEGYRLEIVLDLHRRGNAGGGCREHNLRGQCIFRVAEILLGTRSGPFTRRSGGQHGGVQVDEKEERVVSWAKSSKA